MVLCGTLLLKLQFHTHILLEHNTMGLSCSEGVMREAVRNVGGKSLLKIGVLAALGMGVWPLREYATKPGFHRALFALIAAKD